ncbi:MAG: hypothetical protein JWN32_148, partial [Solirubrobacterales bacterium]|nr:hypothetical protein [Solirubrobacterales bacterium]
GAGGPVLLRLPADAGRRPWHVEVTTTRSVRLCAAADAG